MSKQEIAKADNAVSELFETLNIIGNGELVGEMSASLEEATNAAQFTGKRAEVMIKITIEPDPKSDAFRVWGTVKSKLPAEPTKASLFFPFNGKLSRMDPRQRSMFEEIPNPQQ